MRSISGSRSSATQILTRACRSRLSNVRSAVAIAWQALAQAPTGARQPAAVAAPRLVIWGDVHSTQPVDPRLAWEVAISNVDRAGNGPIGRWYVDAKTGALLRYENDKAAGIDAVVLSTQHDPDVEPATIRREVVEKVIQPVFPSTWLDERTIYHVNPTGRFVVASPDAVINGVKVGRYLQTYSKKDFGPRFGFAYDARGNGQQLAEAALLKHGDYTSANIRIFGQAPANGAHSEGPRSPRRSRPVARHTQSHAAALARGSSISHSVAGKSNHLFLTVSLASGVASETSATPSATQARPQRAQPSALRCSSPSVRPISQQAPSST